MNPAYTEALPILSRQEGFLPFEQKRQGKKAQRINVIYLPKLNTKLISEIQPRVSP